jgi:hypothetical protein
LSHRERKEKEVAITAETADREEGDLGVAMSQKTTTMTNLMHPLLFRVQCPETCCNSKFNDNDH